MTEREIDMVFLDIDGTLYADGQLVQSGIDAVQSLLKQNIPVAVCTGRSVLHARHVQEQLGVPYGIFFNGGLVVSEGRELFSTPFDPQDVTGLIAFARSENISTIVHTHNQAVSFAPIPDKYDPVLRSFDFPKIDVLPWTDEILNQTHIYQINAFMTQERDMEFELRFPACYIYRWDANAVDFQRRKSDKSIGALHLLRHLGIPPEKALHIGDGGNDIGMFKALGHSVAMGNATDDIKRYAKQVTTAATDDGVARALEQLGLLQ